MTKQSISEVCTCRCLWMQTNYTRKERNLPMLKLVIFDMDGLMFDTEAVMCRAFLEVTRENGYPGSRDQFMGAEEAMADGLIDKILYPTKK